MLKKSRIKLMENSEEFLPVTGVYFKLESAFDVVRLQTDVGDFVEINEGDAVYLRPFNRVSVKSSIDQYISFTVGDNDTRVESSRVVGTVGVINGEIERVKRDQAFIRGGALVPAGGNCGSFILRNPLGSGKNIFLNQILLSNPNATQSIIQLGYFNDVVGTAIPVQNKKIGSGVASIADFKTYESATTGSAMGGWVGLGQMRLPPNAPPFAFPMIEPLMIEQSKLIVVTTDTPTNVLTASFQWIEESV